MKGEEWVDGRSVIPNYSSAHLDSDWHWEVTGKVFFDILRLMKTARGFPTEIKQKFAQRSKAE